MDHLEKVNLRSNLLSKATLKNVTSLFYALFTSFIVIAGIAWSFFILMRGFGLSDGVFPKLYGFVLVMVLLMTLGSFFWLIFSVILYFLNQLEENYYLLKMGLVGMFLNIILIYITFVSEAFPWILD